MRGTMRILIGCEKSGRVRDAFIRAGHHAVSCDLEKSDSDFGPHILDDVRNSLHYEKWDAGIFFPPCTFLCGSGLHWNNRGRGWQGTEDALLLVRDLLNCGFENIRLENPGGCISTRLRRNGDRWEVMKRANAKPKSCPPLQEIQPFQFGEDASKKTLLWGSGNWPLLVGTKFINPRMVCQCGHTYPYDRQYCIQCGETEACAKPRWANQTDSGQNRLGPSDDRAELRGKTYQGIADAMATQWGKVIK
jgi:hypothetical protein